MPYDWYEEAQKKANERKHYSLGVYEGNRCWLVGFNIPGKVAGDILARCNSEVEANEVMNVILEDLAQQYHDNRETRQG